MLLNLSWRAEVCGAGMFWRSRRGDGSNSGSDFSLFCSLNTVIDNVDILDLLLFLEEPVPYSTSICPFFTSKSKTISVVDRTKDVAFWNWSRLSGPEASALKVHRLRITEVQDRATFFLYIQSALLLRNADSPIQYLGVSSLRDFLVFHY